MGANVRRAVRALGLPLAAGLASMLLASGLILIAGVNPLKAYWALFSAGYGCRGTGGYCALYTTLQYTTPLLLSGLSATVALRSGMFSIGQAGQMVMGAALGAAVAYRVSALGPLSPALALVGAALGGALWGWIPGVLRARLGINEVITTLFMNPIALSVSGLALRWTGTPTWDRIPEGARLTPLVASTKLTAGLIVGLVAAVYVTIHLWRSARGYEQRMAGQAERFARFGGIRPERAIVQAMMLSGALAGLAGAIEVLGVHYRFVTVFSAVDSFDGLMVALLGQLHPVGVVLSALLLGGIRLGSLNGLQLQTGIPRELGSALIGLTVLLMASPLLYRRLPGGVRLVGRRIGGEEGSDGGAG